MEEYIYDFSDVVRNYSKEEVTLEDIIREVENVSLDKVVGNNMLQAFSESDITYLYSGRVEGIKSGNIVSAIEGARIIKFTEAAYLLENESFLNLI